MRAAPTRQEATPNRPRRPVLKHAGHSDGQQWDLRYWDGAGSFSYPLNGGPVGSVPGMKAGRGILNLGDEAYAEWSAAMSVMPAPPTPKLDRLKAWIAENRTALNAYGARINVRRIYIGESFVSELLLQGRFPGTQEQLPGVTEWTDQHVKILPETDHLDHWHVNTVNR